MRDQTLHKAAFLQHDQHEDMVSPGEGGAPKQNQQSGIEQMSRGVQTAWIVGAIILVGVVLIIVLGQPTASGVSPGEPYVTSAAKHGVEGAQEEYDRAMADLYSDDPVPNAPVDRELEMGQRHVIELNEMICKQTGQNCELARMARRQHVERYGRF